MGFLGKIFNRPGQDKDKIASLLKVDKEALAAFDEAYKKRCLMDRKSDNLFDISAKEMAGMRERPDGLNEGIIGRVVGELLSQTERWVYDGKTAILENCKCLPSDQPPVSKEDIQKLPVPSRPQLTGELMMTDLGGIPSYVELLDLYQKYLTNPNSNAGQHAYHMFRQGLDLLDLDPVTYQIIGTNPNSIGYWLPKVVVPVDAEGFFKIPKTTIIKVPLPLLQLTRIDFDRLTPATIAIVDQFCHKAFQLDDNKDYFVKTGTYSSKFDFRNAHVVGEKEVRELGEYLLYIHFQALSMSHYDLSGRNQPIIYGVSTTNEWCVREFIKDTENRPTIYNGLPLRTEYRAFVDFDTKQVIGIHPYWDAKVMKNRFDNGPDAGTPKMLHDAVTYRACQDLLETQYAENKDRVVEHLQNVLQDSEIPLGGQWSVDVMQNGDDFWIIDMAQADRSAYYKEAVPEELRKRSQESWLPQDVLKGLLA